MKCFIAIISDKKCTPELIADAVENASEEFGKEYVSVMSEIEFSFRSIGAKITLDEKYTDIMSRCQAIVVIRPPINFDLIESFVLPSISKLKEFKLGKVFSVDGNLVENNKFVVISKKALPPYGLQLPLGVTIYER